MPTAAADRKNPNKVYAYDSGGAPWSWQRGKIYVSNDGGHTFALSQAGEREPGVECVAGYVDGGQSERRG